MSTTADTLFPGRIGLGTWKMGEARSARAAEIGAIAHALTLGYRLIDTAELYGSGEAERLVGAALKHTGSVSRAQLCIVSKVMPGNASRRGTVAACEASLERLGCDYLDLYLLHWRGRHRFEDTLEGFGELLQRGLVRYFGVSNLDVEDLEQWRAAEKKLGMAATARANQVYYDLNARGIEYDLLPWQARHGLLTMAYSPLGQGQLVHNSVLAALGAARGATAAQMALAWSIRSPEVVAIPKSSNAARLAENLKAADISLSAEEFKRIDAAFPPPRRKQPLATS